MVKYHKIQSIFKRDIDDPKCPFIIGDWTTPELAFLKDNIWFYEEKFDGTNTGINFDGKHRWFQGRNENSQTPLHLIEALEQAFPLKLMKESFPDATAFDQVTLFGEGVGARIQKGGGNYKSDGATFVLFDVKIGPWWLRRDAVTDIASKLNIQVAPVVGMGTIQGAIEMVTPGFNSRWGDFRAEGLVLKPLVPMFDRKGERIITKVKYKDFQ